MLRLPETLRSELKDPLGPVFTDTEALLERVDGPLIAVGDIVTYHLVMAGVHPDVALFDERTKRDAVDDTVRAQLAEADVVAENPPGTLTESLLTAIKDALVTDGPTRIRVEGEEDLAALPAIVAAPDGASVVYGQPGEGMVHVTVSADTRRFAVDFIERMDGDVDRALALLEVTD
ncbi:MAG: GTP-dependent dephospho-CoA kinase family protein [Halobacteriales archaeon]